jgi:uncharacterized membrane protein
MMLAVLSAEPPTETFAALMDHIAQGFEALGAVILVVGVVWSFVLSVVAWRRSGRPAKAYLALREAFGGTLLLGLEVLVAVASGAGAIRRASASALEPGNADPPR